MTHILGEDFKIDKPMECLRCNHKLDMAAQVDPDGRAYPLPETAHQSSIMLCVNCGYVMILDKDGEPRAPSRREVREIQQDGKVVVALMALCRYLRHALDELKRERDAL